MTVNNFSSYIRNLYETLSDCYLWKSLITNISFLYDNFCTYNNVPILVFSY